jgi:hypothetical protein
MNPMGKYTMIFHQSETLINRRVIAVIGKQGSDPGNFTGAFREMGLHHGVGIRFEQLTRNLQLRLGELSQNAVKCITQAALPCQA